MLIGCTVVDLQKKVGVLYVPHVWRCQSTAEAAIVPHDAAISNTCINGLQVLPDCHAAAVTSVCFLEGPSLTAVSSDANGSLMMHNIAGYTSITAMFTGAMLTMLALDDLRQCSGQRGDQGSVPITHGVCV